MSRRAKWLLGLGMLGCALVLAVPGIDVYPDPCGGWVINCWGLLRPHDCPFEEAAVHLRMVYRAQERYKELMGRYATTFEELVSQEIIDDAAFRTPRIEITLHASSGGWYAAAHGLPAERVLCINEVGVIYEHDTN
jgi:hypothetical protein